MKKIKHLAIAGVILAVVLLVFILSGSKTSGFELIKNFNQEITIYKSSSCGCCGIYANYFQRKGNSDAKIIDLPDIDFIKKKYKIPEQLESCHTTIIGEYFVEGHVPLEAIEKLLKEKPDIEGIAMPGMPSGSPGMPGKKTGDFIVYAVDKNGSYREFARL